MPDQTSPAPHPTDTPRPRWKRRLIRAAAVAFIILLAIGAYLYRQHCPSVKVPTSHFVKQSQNRKVIVFVHGVLGDMDNSWVNDVSHTSWPKLISEDPDLAGYDVYVYGYQSPCEGDVSNITQIATRFGRQLQDDEFFSNYDQIFFIVHSMGGLITKRMLAHLNTPVEIDKLQRVRGAIFIAVPTAGAGVAQIAAWLSSNPQFRNMDPDVSQAFLQAIEQDWSHMTRSRTKEHPFPRGYVAYETKDLAHFRIVPALYTSQESDYTPMPFDYDHIEIVKPNSIQNDVYKWTKSRILETSAMKTMADDNGWFGVTVAGNATLAELVNLVNQRKHVAITFAGCSVNQQNAVVQINGAQLSGKDVPDFFGNTVRPRMSVKEFVVNTIKKDESYEIKCQAAPHHRALLDNHELSSPHKIAEIASSGPELSR
jgi:pimeloyl-ACP methyl ester carboxylesterase